MPEKTENHSIVPAAHDHGEHDDHSHGCGGHGHKGHKHAHKHDHDDHHGHSHGIGGHTHEPANYGPAFLIGITLNTGFIVAEAIYGLKSHSLALLADAGHNVSDVLGLIMAWTAVLAAKRKPTARFTYGLQSSTILAALANAIFLLVATGAIIWEGFVRLQNPVATGSMTIIVVAAVGIAVNGITAWLFMKGSKEDLNIKGAYLHMLSDALVSLGVVVAGFVIMKTKLYWLDPAVSITIGVIIVVGTWGLLRDSVSLALHAVPAHLDSDEVKEFLSKLENVAEVHDLHIWGMSTKETILSVHLVMPAGHPGDEFIHHVSEELLDKFRIGHATIQIEVADAKSGCALAPPEVI